jgi:hypothetical protein
MIKKSQYAVSVDIQFAGTVELADPALRSWCALGDLPAELHIPLWQARLSIETASQRPCVFTIDSRMWLASEGSVIRQDLPR